MKTALNMLENELQVSPRHDLIALANAASFANTFFSQPLTTYAVGFRDPNNLEAELDYLFPPVQVGRRFEFKKATAADDFMVETDDVREPGADFKAVKVNGTIVQSKTLNKGLVTFVDSDEVEDLEMALQQRTGMLLRRIQRNELKRGVAVYLAAATNANKTWDSKADPDVDMLTMLDTAGDALGFNPNRLYVGAAAWSKRIQSLRSQDTAGSFASSSMTPEQVAAFLNVDRAFVSRARYATTATAKAALMGSYVLAFYAEDGLSQEDPSHGKRFWTPVEGGGKYRVYRQTVSEKLTKVAVEHYSNVVATSTTGLRMLTIA
jgi:hypothetical protein